MCPCITFWQAIDYHHLDITNNWTVVVAKYIYLKTQWGTNVSGEKGREYGKV